MGKAEVECISGCECETTVLDGWWERHASLQVMHTVMVRASGVPQGWPCSTRALWRHLLRSSVSTLSLAACPGTPRR